ncbi:MAG: family 78 glycoside hydrolase catalytic domain [Ignavibacteriales bacterium]|nr:family 78 glycoside hydrolase catalytic domain [Ignavibacteriales bacterium]
MIRIFYLIILLTSIAFSQGTKILNLKCEYLQSPNNIDVSDPRFSWEIKSEIRGQKQIAFQILVSDNKNHLGNLWNSDKIKSSQSSQIIYEGKPLQSNRQYFWKVKIWDKDNNQIESEVSEFWTSILDTLLWQAKWIGAGPSKEYFPWTRFFQSIKEEKELPDTVKHNGRSLLLRNQFNANNKIKNARIFITGLGFYELFINGNRIGDHYLSPAKTNYRKEILYDTYDVTENLNKGKNAIGIHLGNGWFNPYKKWWQPYRMQWFGAKRAYLQLHIEYENGEKEVITSNENWKYSEGPILYSCIYDGEIYDANEEIENWSTINFDDTNWQNVNIVQSPGGKLKSHTMPPVKIMKVFEPVKIYENGKNVQVYDMGQNFAGTIKLKVRGKKGTKIKLQFAEDIKENGTIDITSNEHAKAQAIYILKGNGTEIYQPHFTYFGYKYVEVTYEGEKPDIEKIEGLALYTSIENTGKFNCSNETINKIHNATVWSQKSNMIGYPMDCPQRDERLGWFGDVQVTIEEAMFNFDTPQFYMNWLSGIKSNQNIDGDIPIISPRPYIWDEGVEWSSTYLILIWKFYQYFDDEKILQTHYLAMKSYMDFLNGISDNYIMKPGWIGDWGSLVKDWKEGEPVSVPTAFYFWNSEILSHIAGILNYNEDEIYFKELAEKIIKSYNTKFFNTETKDYNDGSQMANAFPLYLDIVPQEYKQEVLNNLVDDIVNENNGHLTTGVLGSKYMIDALVQNERQDIAYLLATQKGYPSWSDMVEKYTTMCEFWTLKQSHNHVMTGSIDAFFYKSLAGINIDENSFGCEKIFIKPYLPDDMSYVNASINTIKGEVKSSWEKKKDKIIFNISIPVNSTAEIYLPLSDNKEIYENGILANQNNDIEFIGQSDSYLKYLVQSGEYNFIIK